MSSKSDGTELEQASSPRSKRSREHEGRSREKDRRRTRSRDRSHRHHRSKSRERRQHHSSSTRHHRSDDRNDKHSHGHRSKRSKHSQHDTRDDTERDITDATNDGMWVEKSISTNSPEAIGTTTHGSKLKRDAWMEESGIDIDYTQRGARPVTNNSKTNQQLVPDYQLRASEKELNVPTQDGTSNAEEQIGQSERPSFRFGDEGSQWRMMKLKNVYQKAENEAKDLDQVGAEVFGSLQAFDEVREERQELDRREIYGANRIDAKDAPTGDLYRERRVEEKPALPIVVNTIETVDKNKISKTIVMDQSSLNKLRASLLKAQLRGDSRAAELEAEYNMAMATYANNKEPEVVVLSAMDARMLATSRSTSTENVNGAKKSRITTNDEISLDDMVREEKRTRSTLR